MAEVNLRFGEAGGAEAAGFAKDDQLAVGLLADVLLDDRQRLAREDVTTIDAAVVQDAIIQERVGYFVMHAQEGALGAGPVPRPPRLLPPNVRGQHRIGNRFGELPCASKSSSPSS